MAEQTQNTVVAEIAQNTGQNGRQFNGSPSTMAASPISGRDILRTIAVHQLPNGVFAAVNGVAVTEIQQGGQSKRGLIFLNTAEKGGFQDGIDEMLQAAVSDNLGDDYGATINCGYWGLQPGRLIHLKPEQALEWGLENTKAVHTSGERNPDGSLKQVELRGILLVSDSAYYGAKYGGAKGRLSATDGNKTFDTFDYKTALKLAKAGTDERVKDIVVDKTGAEIEVRIFPRGTQRADARSARTENAFEFDADTAPAVKVPAYVANGGGGLTSLD